MSKPTLNINLPKSWPAIVRSAMLHIVALAQYAAVYTRSWAADSENSRVRLRAERDHLEQEVALLREEIRIKDARMAALSAHRRPFYPPTQRMAILELRAARGWSLEQAADRFLVCCKTIASWMKRLDESGSDALVQVPVPVNKFPDFVRYAIQRLKALCPTLGKKKLAEVLARAGLHLGTTTIGRIRKERPLPMSPKPQAAATRKVAAKRPNHVWHIDLTTIPTASGLWCSWIPCSLPQCWPFCWWLALILDHYSRRVMGLAIFPGMPNSDDIRAFLGRTIRVAGQAPRHLISDKGSQYWPCQGYARWCKRRNIRPRFGAIGKHGSIAMIERAIRTLKEGFRRTIIPTRRESMRRAMLRQMGWYNEHRPHSTLGGKTPNEVYFHRFPANRRPRIEPRADWPRGSACAQPHALAAGKLGGRFVIEVERLGGKDHLPVVRLFRAA